MTTHSKLGLDAPFPWFGGKKRVSKLVWERFGKVKNYVEPFFGSGAVLLGRTGEITGTETVNDLDGFVCNFWRSVKLSPEETAKYADNPVNENDLHARHAWLVSQRESLVSRLEGNPDFHCTKIAGYWAWGVSCWIGSGFCSGKGPWIVDKNKQLVHLGDNGRGVNRQLVHLGNGQGVNRLEPWFLSLCERLQRVRICSGDWSRICGPSVTFKHGLTAVFLDPPYADTANRDKDLYRCDSESVAHDVRKWAVENGDNKLLRIALCGYEGEHVLPDTWDCIEWKATCCYGSADNAEKERIWFSPHCVAVEKKQMSFF